MNKEYGQEINSIITAPSLKEEENVSGVAAVVSETLSLFKDGDEVRFTHLKTGAKDKDSNFNRVFNSAETAINLARLLPNADIVHINTAMMPKSILRDYYLVSYCYNKKPIVLHVHGGKYIDRAPNLLLKTLVRRMVRLSNQIIVLSEREREIFTSVYGLEADRISALPNFVAALDEDTLLHTVAAKRANQKLKVVFVGRLEREKGLAVIVDAYSKAPQLRDRVEMDVYGTGSLGDWFCARMTELLGSNFQYRGVVSRSQIKGLLSQYNVILLPSLFGEGLPMALLEGMAAGCAPFASALASVPGLVKTDVTGVLLQPGSAEEVAAKLTWAVHNRDLLDQISVNAANHIRQNYNPNDFKRSLLTIYRRETARDLKELSEDKSQGHYSFNRSN